MGPIIEIIARYAREHYEPASSAELEAEAKFLADQLRKQAAGRVCWQSREEREAALENGKKRLEEQKEFYRIVGPAYRPSFRPR